jgi:hypothetical protein
MDVQAAEAFTSPGLINRLDIVTAPDADTSAVARRVQSILPDGLRVEAVAQRKADLRTVLRSMQVLLQGVSLVALAAAFIIAFSRLSMCFAERTWQLGVLRAVGVRRRTVWWELLKESQLLGLAGVALARASSWAGRCCRWSRPPGAQLPHRRADRRADRPAARSRPRPPASAPRCWRPCGRHGGRRASTSPRRCAAAAPGSPSARRAAAVR